MTKWHCVFKTLYSYSFIQIIRIMIEQFPLAQIAVEPNNSFLYFSVKRNKVFFPVLGTGILGYF